MKKNIRLSLWLLAIQPSARNLAYEFICLFIATVTIDRAEQLTFEFLNVIWE